MCIRLKWRCGVLYSKAIFHKKHSATLVGFILFCSCLLADSDVPPYNFERPIFLVGPEISNSLMGSTYAYTARNSNKDIRLLITVMNVTEIRERFSELSNVQCINLFLEELKKVHEQFFSVNMTRPLSVGSAEFLRFRWTGEKSDKTMIGVLSCGRLKDNYYVIHFTDALKSATHSFPAIRTSLKTLRPSEK